MNHALSIDSYRLEVVLFPLLVPVTPLNGFTFHRDRCVKRQLGRHFVKHFLVKILKLYVGGHSVLVGYKALIAMFTQQRRHDIGHGFVTRRHVDAYLGVIIHCKSKIFPD